MDATVAARRQTWFVAALLLLFAALSVQYTLKAAKNRSAFVRWRDQVLALDAGTDIYRTYNYPNPPIMALMLRPLMQPPPAVGAVLWFYLKVAMVLAVFAAIFRIVEEGGVSFPPWAKAVAVLLSLRPLIGDLSHGNVNILILFLVVVALYAFRRNRPILAGIVLALAIACKVTPALFVPYFLWKRQYRVLAGVALGLGIFLFAVPGAVLGQRENAAQLRSWTERMVLPYLRDGVVTSEHQNQSLPGVAHRLLTHSPSFSAYPKGVYTPTEYHNVADIGPSGARWLVRLAQLAFAVLVVATCRAKRDDPGWRWAAEFGFVLIGMLAFSERTWKHHCVTLVVPFAVLAYAVAVLPLARAAKGWLIGAVVAASLLMFATSGGLLDERGSDLVQVYGPYVWAFALLIAAQVVVVIEGRRVENVHALPCVGVAA